MPSSTPSFAQCPYTDSNGVPRESAIHHQTAGKEGPLLLQDFQLIDTLTAFNRERIPERVVHAKGAGALGEWETVDEGFEDLCCAALAKPSTKAPIVVRFSTVGGETGSSDSARDPRGFSVKIKTPEGNLDWVGNNTPVFFLRDPSKFPVFIHTQKRNPQTNLKDADMFWDYLGQNPESIHQLFFLFGDRGTPLSFRHMHGWVGHTMKWVNAKGEWKYVQIHYESDLGFKTHTAAEAAALDGSNPDSATQDLFEAIERKDYPTWTAYVQTMTAEQAAKFRYSVNDLTKVWPKGEFPMRKIGKFTLNENPSNYFAQIEQAAFAPSHLIPGMEPSNDPVLQSRLFAYPDAHRYRLGQNYKSIPVNCPYTTSNYHRSGKATTDANGGSAPNYPSSAEPMKYAKRPYTLSQIADNHEGPGVISMTSEIQDLDFEQPRVLWERVFDDGARKRFVENVAGHMSGVTRPELIERQLRHFTRVSPDLGRRLTAALKEGRAGPKL